MCEKYYFLLPIVLVSNIMAATNIETINWYEEKPTLNKEYKEDKPPTITQIIKAIENGQDYFYDGEKWGAYKKDEDTPENVTKIMLCTNAEILGKEQGFVFPYQYPGDILNIDYKRVDKLGNINHYQIQQIVRQDRGIPSEEKIQEARENKQNLYLAKKNRKKYFMWQSKKVQPENCRMVMICQDDITEFEQAPDDKPVCFCNVKPNSSFLCNKRIHLTPSEEEICTAKNNLKNTISPALIFNQTNGWIACDAYGFS
ncbi:MAG: hypothetical protein AAF380_01280, partial [Bacteroidota bacterium]